MNKISLDFNTRSDVGPALNLAIAREVYKSHKPDHRPYLGASCIARECDREIYYKTVQQNTGEITSEDGLLDFARMQRIFWRGHHGEDYIADLLVKAGIGLQTMEQRDDGSIGQIEVVYDPRPYDNASDWRCMGHLDGVIAEAPGIKELDPYLPAVWENKIVNEKSYNALKRGTIRSWKPVYYGQAQFYMGALGYRYTVFSVVNANTMEIQFCIVEFSTEYFNDLIKRVDSLLMYLNNGVLPARLPLKPRAKDKEPNACKYCDYYSICRE